MTKSPHQLDVEIAEALARPAGTGTDRSTHPNVVEYAVQSLFKGKSPKSAAQHAAKKHSGSENFFFGPGITTIDAKLLEDAVWERLVDFAIKGLKSLKAGKEHYALDGTLQHFKQKPALRTQLKQRVLQRLGHDPFSQDDKK